MDRFLTPRMIQSMMIVIIATSVTLGCGMRGAPLAPLVFVPDAVSAFEVQRFDGDVFVQLEIPSENTDGTPADLERVEVYALTTQPSPGAAQPFVLDEWLELATLVATVPVLERAAAPPLADAPESDGDAESVRQGEDVTLVERLTPELLVPVSLESSGLDADEGLAEIEVAPLVAPLVSPPLPAPPRRTYLAIAVSTRGRESSPSPRLDVSLASPTPSPGSPTVTYTESVMHLEWTAPSGARRPIQAPDTDEVLSSEPVVELSVPTAYLVYRQDPSVTPSGPDTPEPLNAQPVTALEYADSGVTFGEERCYVVRAFDEVDSLTVRGPASAPGCVVPVDTFPPSAPTGIIAVAGRDAISLVWDASPEPDIAGYLVLRAASPGATLQRLTPDPITETTHLDPDVESDRRYRYVIHAVDNAVPPNISPPSREVIEQAR